MSIVVIGTVFVDIKGFPEDTYVPDGRNTGRIEYVHGGVARNVVEDIANLELRPTFVSIVDETPMGKDVYDKLRKHKVNVDYVIESPNGMGTWLAVFNEKGDVAGSISCRPDPSPILSILEEKGDEIFVKADSVIIQIDLHKDIVKKIFQLAEKYGVKTYALVSNMNIAVQRRDFLQQLDCFICNEQEAGILFLEDYSESTPEEMVEILAEKIKYANIKSMIVTMGAQGAVYAHTDGDSGICPAKNVVVKDTTGAGDAFCAGVMAGLTYGKSLADAIEIGSTLASSVITSSENVCPRFLPEELGLNVEQVR